MMTSHCKSSLVSLVVLAILVVTSSIVRAQQEPPAAKKEKELEQRQELEKKTLALLNDVASAAWSLKLPENRLFVMSSTAELLWTFDEKRARTLYWEALNSLNSATQPAQPARSTGKTLSKAERDKIVQAYMSTFTLRQQLLRKVAQRDALLALEMLRATRVRSHHHNWDCSFHFPMTASSNKRSPVRLLTVIRRTHCRSRGKV